MGSACFSAEWLERFLIMLVVIAVVVLVLKVAIPLFLGTIGVAIPPPILQLFRILMWGAIMIVGIIICFELFRCFIGSVHL